MSEKVKEALAGLAIVAVIVPVILPVVMGFFLVVTAGYVFFGWNWFIHEVFQMKEITFAQAIGGACVIFCFRSVIAGLTGQYAQALMNKDKK